MSSPPILECFFNSNKLPKRKLETTVIIIIVHVYGCDRAIIMTVVENGKLIEWQYNSCYQGCLLNIQFEGYEGFDMHKAKKQHNERHKTYYWKIFFNSNNIRVKC